MCPKLTHVLFHEGAVVDAAFSPDGRRIVTASEDQTARVWDAATGQPVTPPMKHEGRCGTAPRSARTADASSPPVGTIRRGCGTRPPGQPISPPMKHEGTVNHAAFSPDGRRIVTASEDKTARVWDAATGQPVSPPLKHERLCGSRGVQPRRPTRRHRQLGRYGAGVGRGHRTAHHAADEAREPV